MTLWGLSLSFKTKIKYQIVSIFKQNLVEFGNKHIPFMHKKKSTGFGVVFECSQKENNLSFNT